MRKSPGLKLISSIKCHKPIWQARGQLYRLPFYISFLSFDTDISGGHTPKRQHHPTNLRGVKTQNTIILTLPAVNAYKRIGIIANFVL